MLERVGAGGLRRNEQTSRPPPLVGAPGSSQLQLREALHEHPFPVEAPLVKTVYLLRHAKSSWDQPYLEDYHRPLALRGMRAAPRLGRYMAREELIPQRVLCSGAQRARETWELVSDALGVTVPVEFTPDIYHGSTRTLVDLIQALPNTESSVLLVGHNPTFHHLALSFAESGEEEALQKLRFKYPTCALVILDFSVQRWSGVAAGTGHLRDFIRSKALKKG